MEVLKTASFGVPVLTVTGAVDHLSAEALEESVQESLEADHGRLLVDLSECPYMDSGGLSVLLCAVRDVKGRGWIGLIAPSGNLLRMFEIVGLAANPDVRFFADRDEATAALEVRGSDA